MRSFNNSSISIISNLHLLGNINLFWKNAIWYTSLHFNTYHIRIYFFILKGMFYIFFTIVFISLFFQKLALEPNLVHILSQKLLSSLTRAFIRSNCVLNLFLIPLSFVKAANIFILRLYWPWFSTVKVPTNLLI